MLSESEQRAAVLAVSRYGADLSRIQLVVQSVLQLRSQGDGVDLLDLFQREQLLTPSQIRELRFGLEKTLVEPTSKNGFAPPDADGSANNHPHDPLDQKEEDLGSDLRTLGDYRILRRLGEGGTG